MMNPRYKLLCIVMFLIICGAPRLRRRSVCVCSCVCDNHILWMTTHTADWFYYYYYMRGAVYVCVYKSIEGNPAVQMFVSLFICAISIRYLASIVDPIDSYHWHALIYLLLWDSNKYYCGKVEYQSFLW